jgi:hypothetical protein
VGAKAHWGGIGITNHLNPGLLSTLCCEDQDNDTSPAPGLLVRGFDRGGHVIVELAVIPG